MATFHENLKTTFARFRDKYVGYTTCATAADTAAKTASLTNFALATGSQVKVKFTYANTASAPTLNINSTGAKSIKAYGTTAPTVWWNAGDVVSFTYDGTNWIMEATNGQIHSLNSSFSSALTALKNTAIAQAVGATGSTFTAVIDKLATIVNRGAVSQTLNTSTTSYTVPAGYHDGSGKVSITTQTKSASPSTSAQTISPDSGKVLSSVSISAMPLPDVAAKWSDNTLNIVEGSLGSRGTCTDGVVRSVFEIPQGKYYGGRSARELIGITDDKMMQLGWSMGANGTLRIGYKVVITLSGSNTYTPTFELGIDYYVTNGAYSGLSVISGSASGSWGTVYIPYTQNVSVSYNFTVTSVQWIPS